MAEDKKQPPVPEAHTTPEAPAPETLGGPAVEEQATIPGMESGPAPSGKVIDLSDAEALCSLVEAFVCNREIADRFCGREELPR